jgi:tetratricopeptide (TPR) repeat protein
VSPWAAPPLADCFTVRPHTGPGPLDARPPGEWLVLTGPLTPAQGKAVHDWPGGTGKTQLAVHLARTWRQRNPAGLLVWLTAASRDEALSGYVYSAAQATAEQHNAGQGGTGRGDDAEAVAARFLAGLTRTSQPWLVVLDGLLDPADLDGLWPQGRGSAGRVLVTATDSAAIPGSPSVFPVSEFSSHEALTYLVARLNADPDQRLGAMDLVHDLGCDPLALAHATAAMASSGISCRDYLELFAKRRDQIAEGVGAEPAAKAVTWTLSVECADEFAPGGRAQSCLALAALLGCRGIPETVLSTRAATEFVAGSPEDPGRVDAALDALHSVGLLTIDPPGDDGRLVRVHRAVQAAVMSAMPGSMRERAARAAADALLQAWPDGADRTPLACALRACAASLEQAAADVLWSGSHHVLLRAGQSLDDAGLSGPAVRHWRSVADASERALGPAHPDTVLATTRLGSAALAAGLGDDAVALYQRALDTQAGAMGSDHPSTVAARVDFGRALLAAGRPAEAITILGDVLAVAATQPAVTDVLAVTDTLVAAYQAGGQHDEAIRLARRALAERERIQGLDHPDTMRTRRTLVRACLAAGAAKDAIAHGRRALSGAQRVLGPDDPGTVDAATVLAMAYHSARRLKDAIPLYEWALAGQERIKGPDDPETIGVRGNLASAYHSAGRMATALELYERTRADCQRVLGAEHPDTLTARANLAHGYYAMGRLTEARTLLLATLADCERVLPPDDPLTAAVRDSLDAAQP